MPTTSEQLALLRAINPTGAFSALLNDFSIAVKEDREMAAAFKKFQKNFKITINTREDSIRIAALKAKGADKLGLKLGSFPLIFSAGLSAMYDTAVEALRSSDPRIAPRMFSARGIGAAEHLMKPFLLQLGPISVTALERALKDKSYADRLRQRAQELKVIGLIGSSGNSPCEFCTISNTDPNGEVTFQCLSEEECSDCGNLFLNLDSSEEIVGRLRLRQFAK